MNDKNPTNQPTSPTSSESPISTVSEQQPLVPQVTTAELPTQKPNKKKLKYAILILVTLLVIGGLGGFLLITSKNKSNGATTNKATKNNPSDSQSVQNHEMQPYGLLQTNPIKLQPLDNSSTIVSTGLDKGASANISDIRKNKVLVLEFGANVSNNALYYSEDSGKTFKMLYSTNVQNGVVISGKFSVDGNSAVFSVSGNDTEKSTIIEVSLDGSKTTKDLLLSKRHGEFDDALYVDRYDSKAKQLLYYYSCFGCSRSSHDNETMTDLISGADKAIYTKPTSSNYIPQELTINRAGTKFIVVTSTPVDGPSLSAPYIIEEYDIALRKVTKRIDVPADSEPTYDDFLFVGFTDDTDALYYAALESVNVLDKDGNTSVLYTGKEPIQSIQFVSSDRVIAIIGDDAIDTHIIDYDVKTKSTTKDITAEESAYRYSGLVWK